MVFLEGLKKAPEYSKTKFSSTKDVWDTTVNIEYLTLLRIPTIYLNLYILSSYLHVKSLKTN